MGNRIPEDLIERIRTSVDIVDVVSEYVQLKKQGRNYFGLCPFHQEKSPSFSVSPDKQIYHCFGCGAGGNVFSFLMEIEGYHYIEAVKTMAGKSGLELPADTVRDTDAGASAAGKQHHEMVEAHDLLKKLYHHILVNTKEGEHALEYLTGRGFTREAIDLFEIGYAPDSADMASAFLSKRGYSADMLLDSGLIGRDASRNRYYDRFRGRVMFPVWDHQGKTIAFGGRILGNGEPKYLNSPETKIFNKSKQLYGLHLARPHIRKMQQAVLFEGYVDVISAWRAGVKNGIATMGTSLTDEQARIIRRNIENVVICYDSDNAGINAAMRALDVLQHAGCYVKVARMPEGLDPDDYISKFGPERFEKDVIGGSLTATAFKIHFLRRGKNLQNEGEKIRYIEEVLGEISKLTMAVERDHYLRQISDEFSISLDALKQEQFRIFKQLKRKEGSPNQSGGKYERKIARLPKQGKLLPAYQNAERHLIAHMFYNRDLAEQIQNEIGLSFNIDEHNAIAAYLYAFYEEGHEPDISSFMERLQDNRLKKAASELAMLPINENFSDREWRDYVKQVLDYPKWLKIKEKEAEKNEAEQRQDHVKAATIAMEIIRMKKELKGS